MSALTAHEAGLEKMYKKQEESYKLEEDLQDEVECHIDEVLSSIVTSYKEQNLYIDNRRAMELVYEYATKELKRMIKNGASC